MEGEAGSTGRQESSRHGLGEGGRNGGRQRPKQSSRQRRQDDRGEDGSKGSLNVLGDVFQPNENGPFGRLL